MSLSEASLWRRAVPKSFYECIFHVFSFKRRYFGIPVGIFMPRNGEILRILPKIRRALHLIDRYDPSRFRVVEQHVGRILVFGTDEEHRYRRGSWIDDCRMCVLVTPWVAASDTRPAEVASTIVHETTHARLCRAGVRYHEGRRARIEHLCARAQIAFARKLPNNQDLLATARMTLEEGDEYWTDDAHQRRKLQILAEMNAPRWVLRLSHWLVSRSRG